MAHNQGGLVNSVNAIQPQVDSAIERITLQNYDSNPAKVNQFQNQKQFLALTTQDRQQFSSKTLDISFNDGAGSVGMNPFFRPPETATKVFTA